MRFTFIKKRENIPRKIKGVKRVEMETIYDEIQIELLAGFYYHIHMNIKKGILSEAMYYEIELIKQAAKRKGICLNRLYQLGSDSHTVPPRTSPCKAGTT